MDINRHEQIKRKTRLNLIDAIFGAYDYHPLSAVKMPWQTFGEERYPKSIFVGTDPIAVESVAYAYVQRERRAAGLEVFEPRYLADAERQGIGVFEASDDVTFSKIDYRQFEVS